MANIRQKKVLKIVENEGKSLYAATKEVYSEGYARSGNLKKTKSWQELMDAVLPDEKLMGVHNELLASRRLDHMTFTPQATDDEIKELIGDTGCVLRKIVHGEMAKHVYFWAPDNLARDRALDKAYKLKGKYAAEKIEIHRDKTLEELDREERELEQEKQQLLAEIKRDTAKRNRARSRKKAAGKRKQKESTEVPPVLPEQEGGGVHTDSGGE